MPPLTPVQGAGAKTPCTSIAVPKEVDDVFWKLRGNN